MRPLFIAGSFSPFAMDTENASIARPTPSRMLLMTKTIFHSIVSSPPSVPGNRKTQTQRLPCLSIQSKIKSVQGRTHAQKLCVSHESRILKQARPAVSMLTCCMPDRHACYSLKRCVVFCLVYPFRLQLVKNNSHSFDFYSIFLKNQAEYCGTVWKTYRGFQSHNRGSPP